jgi:CRISPR/Cas system-associated protein Cas10 (large subunit of type III CRISPR-Cas system)
MSNQSSSGKQTTNNALAELRELLSESYEVTLRLKRDVPSEAFPNAYQLSQTVRELRKLVEDLHRQLNEDTVAEFDFSLNLIRPDMLNSSDSSANIC